MTEPTSRPAKKYHSIREVSAMLEVAPHVLRYWETQFSVLRPRKNRAGTRMYQERDLDILRSIREMLYDRGYTISGARQRLLRNDDAGWRRANRRPNSISWRPTIASGCARSATNWRGCSISCANRPRDRPRRPIFPLNRRGGATRVPVQVSGRGVAQPGSALAWGASGRWFKSSRPDQFFVVTPRGGRPGARRRRGVVRFHLGRCPARLRPVGEIP